VGVGVTVSEHCFSRLLLHVVLSLYEHTTTYEKNVSQPKFLYFGPLVRESASELSLCVEVAVDSTRYQEALRICWISNELEWSGETCMELKELTQDRITEKRLPRHLSAVEILSWHTHTQREREREREDVSAYSSLVSHTDGRPLWLAAKCYKLYRAYV